MQANTIFNKFKPGQTVRVFANSPNGVTVYVGMFINIQPRNTTFVQQGPYLDDYLQIRNKGERPVLNAKQKLVGWEEGTSIQSIPFRNIIDIQ